MTSTLGKCQPSPADLRPPPLQSIPEAIDKTIAIARVRTRSQIMAVVKADGYGHGSIPVRGPRSPPDMSGHADRWRMAGAAQVKAHVVGRSLILRRRTPETASKARADAERAGAVPLPLWLAREHIPFSRGSIAGSGPRVMGLIIGGLGENVAGMSVETAKQLGIRIEYDRPEETSAGLQPVTVYPCYPKEVRLGNAAAKDAYCIAIKQSANAPHGFDVLGHFSHSFFKPHNITLDFTDMNLYIARGKAT